MNRKSISISIIQRILAPIIFGTLVYLLVLLFFDSLQQLSNNFFGKELSLSVILLLILNELLRLNIFFFNKSNTSNIKLNILLQSLSGIVLTYIVTHVSLQIYFVYFEGFSIYTSELISFFSILGMYSILFNLWYFSHFFLRKQNTEKIEHEQSLRRNLELEVQSFKSNLNPDFLVSSLETILSILGTDTFKTDKIVNKLSELYRYLLLNKNQEFVPVSKEISAFKNWFGIVNTHYNNGIKLELTEDEYRDQIQIIPGTLLIFGEYIISQNIISCHSPFIFNAKLGKQQFELNYLENKRLNLQNFDSDRIEKLKKAWSIYSSNNIEIKNDERNTTIIIPLIIIDE